MNELRNYNDSCLSWTQLLKVCPAAFSSGASNSVSEKYNFISTENIIKILAKNNFFPHSAMQSGARSMEKIHTTKHMIKFRHSESRPQLASAGGLIPEIVLMTSHDGLSSFRFMSGIFRFVCLNGLIVADINSSINIRHMGCKENDVIDAVFEVLDSSKKALENSSKMQKIELSQAQKFEFASEAFQLRWDNKNAPDFSPTRLLEPKRSEERSSDLFSTFNVVQENLIRGGTFYYTRSPVAGLKLDRHTTRAVNSIDANLKINKGLWELTQKYLG